MTMVAVESCLSLIWGGERVIIKATDSRETLPRAQELFTEFLDPEFVNLDLDVSDPMPEREVAVYEMIDNGRTYPYAQIYRGLGDLNRLCLTWDQIKTFVRDQTKWLRAEGCGTLFLVKVRGKISIADVHVHEAGRRVFLDNFAGYDALDAKHKHRVVLPRLALES